MVVKSWGTGTPPRDEIVAAALALIDSDGLAELSMRKLAAEMGVHVNSLYRRVSSRDELLDLVGDEVLASVSVPVREGAWDEFLVDVAEGIREAIFAHPNTGPLLNTMTRGTPALFHLEDAIFGALLDAGFTGEDLLVAHGAYMGFVVGSSVVEVMQRPGAEAADVTPTDLTAEERAAYPHLAQAVQAIDAIAEQVDDVWLFRAGTAAVLRGLTDSASRRPRSGRPGRSPRRGR